MTTQGLLIMLYLWLKFIHVISSTILFGTGIGTACVMLYGHRTRDTHVIAAITRYVVFADWVFTAPSAAVQMDGLRCGLLVKLILALGCHGWLYYCRLLLVAGSILANENAR
jgi:uncharacterized membrane protein